MISRLLLALAAIAVAVDRLWVWLSAPASYFDDAYMFVRYADAWLHGHGLRWNPTDPPVYGATGLLHLAIVTGLRAMHVSDARAIMSASTGAAVAAMVVLVLLVARFASEPMLRRAAVLVAPLVVYSEAFGFHATTGMDTMSSLLTNAVLALAVLAWMERPTARASVLCAIAGWIAIEARPENAVVAFGVPILAVILPAGGEPRPDIRRLLAVLSTLVGASLIAKKIYFGTALPLSFWVKRPGFYGGHAGEYTWNPFWFLAVFLRAAAPILIVLVLGARRRHARKLVVLLVPAAVGIAALFGMNQIMGHLGRFYFPWLAWLVAATAIASDGVRELHLRSLLARAAIAAAVLLGGLQVLQGAGTFYETRAATQHLADLGGYQIDAQEPLPERDSWQSSIEMAGLAAAAPPATRFAMSEHGLVAARAPKAIIIDLLGLHDRDFALHGFSAKKLLDRTPALIWMPHPDYTQMIRDLYDEPRFWSEYDYWPDALTFGVALRRDASPELRALYQARFAADYPGTRLDDHRAHAAPASQASHHP